ncbi:hypothetical protein MASR2M117_11800 [Paludibacter sp.]
MRKFVLALVVMTGMFCVANAQVDKKAIGVRGGGGSYELSYQHPLSDATRLELDLGYSWFTGVTTYSYGTYPYTTSITGITGVYQWVKDWSSITSGLNWYYGVGAGLGFGAGFGVGVVGQLGAEYTFAQFPIQVSLDYRPGVYLITGAPSKINLGLAGYAFGVRYKF